METKAGYVAVGLFVMALLIGLVGALLWLAGAQFDREFAYYQTTFKGAVTGLGKGTVVRYDGIEVGRVQDLRFDPDDPKAVIVMMQTRPDLNIRTDSQTSLESEGLTGGVYVEISGGSKNAPVLYPKPGESYAVIASKPSAIEALAEAAPQLLARISQAVDGINRALGDKNQAALTGTLQHLDTVTGALAEETPKLDATLRNLSVASAKFPQVVDDADQDAKKIGKLSDDADAFVAGSDPAELTRLVADTRQLVENLNRLTEQLNRQPTSVLFGDRRKGYTPNGK